MSFRIKFDSEEEHKIADLKKVFGIKATTELIRFLLNQAWINANQETRSDK